MPRYFVTAARGLESTTAAELTALGATQTEVVPGGVFFEGAYDLLYKAHLWLRTASRVLFPLREFLAPNPDAVYEGVKDFRWEAFFQPRFTFSVDATVSMSKSMERGGRGHPFNNSHFLRLRVKDAVVDRLREKRGTRPDVSIEDPDLTVYVHIREGKCFLYLDATGPSLHERGYRPPGAPAPLKETLAAGLVDLTGWDGSVPLADPLCGSGTILVEAALKAGRRAPGLLRRRRFLFMNWPEFNPKRWQELVEEAESMKCEVPAGLLYGCDSHPNAIRLSRQSLQRAGLSPNSVQFSQKELKDFRRPEGAEKGVLLANPPYGERLGEAEELGPLYKSFGDLCKQEFKGWDAYLFTGSSELAKQVGLRTSARIPLFNGSIECRLLRYELY